MSLQKAMLAVNNWSSSSSASVVGQDVKSFLPWSGLQKLGLEINASTINLILMPQVRFFRVSTGSYTYRIMTKNLLHFILSDFGIVAPQSGMRCTWKPVLEVLPSTPGDLRMTLLEAHDPWKP